MLGIQRSPELLDRDRSRLLIIDLQERLLPVMQNANHCVLRCVRLVQGAQLLGIPVSATEQYPKGLGSTVSELKTLLGPCHEKLRFSSADVLDWATQVQPDVRDQVVLAGIEAHVCVQQTALDLVARGFRVFVVADAVSSRSLIDQQVAFNRMVACGVTITTLEAVLFEWCETASDPLFKQVSALVKPLQ